MIKLGIIFDKIVTNQIVVSLILQLEQLSKINSELAIAIFAEEQFPLPMKINFPIYPLADAYFSDYIFIANNIGTANKLVYFPNTSSKFYFIHFPEWLYIKNKKFAELNTIYNSKKLELVVPSLDYQQIVQKTWNRTPLLIERFSLQKLLNLETNNDSGRN